MRQLREPWKELLKMPIEVIDNLLRLYPRHVRLHTFLALQGKIPFFAAAEAASREEYEQRLAHHGHLLPSVPHRLYAIGMITYHRIPSLYGCPIPGLFHTLTL